MTSLLSRIEKLESVLPQVGEDRILFVSFVGADSEDHTRSAACAGRTFTRGEESVDEFKARIDEETRRHYAKLYARPGAMHSAFEQFATFNTKDAADNKEFQKKGKLTMPILALGAEKSFGATQAVVMREVSSNVEGGIIANSGHWIMEEQPDQTVKAVKAFLDKK